MESSAYLVLEDLGYTYHFTGVVSVEYNFALNIGNDSSQGGDIINGAKNLPDQVTLSVVESDTAHSAGWSAKMLEAMKSVKQNRYLCRLVTPMGSFRKMLLTEITASEDAGNACGWSGDLVFMQYLDDWITVGSSSDSGESSTRLTTRKHTGTKNTGVVLTGDALAQVLQRSGIG